MRVLRVLILALIATLTVGQAQNTDNTTIAIIMDASGSMQALLEPGRSRIAVARDEIIALSSTLDSSVNASLWIYGHRLSQDDPVASCQDIEQVIAAGPVDPQTFAAEVSTVQAIGYTPIADALGLAASSLSEEGSNIIVLMSDGEESCGGDPCAVAGELARLGIELRVHTIGFAADAGTRAQLQCIAEVTGGSYFEAQDTDTLRYALEAATTKLTGTIALVRPDGKPVTDVSFSAASSDGEIVTNVGSGIFSPGEYTVTINTDPSIETTVTVVAGEIATVILPNLGTVRAVDEAGEVVTTFPITAYRPGTSDIVGFTGGMSLDLPPGLYDIAVGSSDNRQTVTLAAGETLDVVVRFGILQLVDESGNPVDDYPLNVYTPDSVEVVAFSTTGTATVLAGSYDLEVQTNPRLFSSIGIEAGQTTEVVIPGSGTLELVDSEGMLVSDYSFYITPASGNAQQTIFTLDGTIDLLAGDYEVDVRTNPPIRQSITITTGETTQLVVPGVGVIQLLDADGNATDAYAFYVTPADGSTVIGTTDGRLTVAAGVYEVEVYTNPALIQTVTVEAGETATIQVGAFGTLEILDAAGAQDTRTAFYVYAPDDGSMVTTGIGSVEVAPGTYRVEIATSPLTVEIVTIRPGETTTVQLDTPGTIEIVDRDGAINGQYFFYVSPEGSRDIIATGMGSSQVMPGVYTVEVYSDPIVTQTVTVVGGETVQIVVP